MQIVKDIYIAHYWEWYNGLGSGKIYEQIVKALLTHIESGLLVSSSPKPIVFIQCQRLDECQFPKFEIENYTISTERKYHRRKIAIISIWLLLSITTFAEWFAKLRSFLTIISGLISIVAFRKDIFER